VAGRRAPSARQAQRRSLSQNFLRSERLAAELVADADVQASDFVVELGAGSGRLTDALGRRAREVLAVEVDPRWATHLRARFSSQPNVRVVESDLFFAVLPDQAFRVLANVPFHRSAEVLRHLLDDPTTPLARADLILQWGAACKRATVWPSTLLGVYWGAWYTFTVSRRLPACCFIPVPDVDAGVLTVGRRAHALAPEVRAQEFRTFVAAGFSCPRLRQGLADFFSDRRLRRLADSLAFPRDAAARDLDVHQWTGLFRAYDSGARSRGS